MAKQPENEPEAPSTSVQPPRVDEVYHKILLRIIRRELLGGAELKSAVIARELGLSRTPVVQALARLTADGIVSQRPNHHAVVRKGAENWLVEIHEIRELLEPRAAALASIRIENEEITRLEALAQMARPQKSETWIEASRQFDFALHLAIAESCGQLALTEAIRKCWSFKRLSYEAIAESAPTLARGYNEHVAILEALKSHDGPTAEAAMLLHLRSTKTLRSQKRIV